MQNLATIKAIQLDITNTPKLFLTIYQCQSKKIFSILSDDKKGLFTILAILMNGI